MTAPRALEDAAASAAILRARARALAVPVADEHVAKPGAELEMLVARAGDERIGIPLDHIASVGRPTRVTPLPRAVLPVFGVAAWRGRPLTVLVLGSSLPAQTEDTRFVVLGDGRRAAVALLVDALDDVQTVARESLSAPGAGGGRGAPALGVSLDGITVVDVDALLRESP